MHFVRHNSVNSLTGDHVNEAEMPVAIINRKISQIWCSNESKILVTPSFLAIAITWRLDFQSVQKVTTLG
jgi:hypothetical protein